MLDNVNAEPIVTTICASKLLRIVKAVHLHFCVSCLQVSDRTFSLLIMPFYTFYTILGNWHLDRVECEGKEQCRCSDPESVESVDAQVGGHVLSRWARVGMCRR